MKISNLKEAQRFLKQLKAKYAGASAKNSVIVGYTAAYALNVHENKKMQENREARGVTKRQWKFLEQPARELSNSGEIQRIVNTAVASGASLEDGLLLAGLRIQRESQKLVPIDTGNLRASAFTRKESGNTVTSTRRG